MTEALLQNLSDLEESLSRAGLDPGPHRKLLARIRTHLRRYATLENELWGGGNLAVPRHLLEGEEPEEGEDPLAGVESLARRERGRLGFGGTAGGDLMRLLDREGLKVYRPQFPEGSPLRGIFLFDEEVGPAFVIDGRLSQAVSNAVAARLYGHYLLDHDPYQIRLVVAGDAVSGARALRGAHFAVAFLIGGRELTDYLKAAGWDGTGPVERALLDQLSLFFEVQIETVVARLLSLGLLDAATMADLPLAQSPESPPDREEGVVGERFVRLVLEAQATGRIGMQELARYLETDLPSARRIAGQFEAGNLDSEKGEG